MSEPFDYGRKRPKVPTTGGLSGLDIACDIIALGMPIGWAYQFAAAENWPGVIAVTLLFEAMLALVVVRRLKAAS